MKQQVPIHLLEKQKIESKSPENVTLGDLLIDIAILERQLMRANANIQAIKEAINEKDPTE